MPSVSNDGGAALEPVRDEFEVKTEDCLLIMISRKEFMERVTHSLSDQLFHYVRLVKPIDTIVVFRLDGLTPELVKDMI